MSDHGLFGKMDKAAPVFQFSGKAGGKTGAHRGWAAKCLFGNMPELLIFILNNSGGPEIAKAMKYMLLNKGGTV